jgi:hypothetical protein
VSQSDLESLPPELARLLAAEKTRPDPPADMQARVLERFGEEFLSHPSTPAGPASAASPDVAPLLLRRLPLAVTMLALGGLGGAALHAYLRKPVQTTIYVPVPVAPPIPAPVVPADPVEPAPPIKSEHRREPPPRRPPRTPSAAVPPSPPPTPGEVERQFARDRELAAERALIEQARTALARGKAADALVLLGQHARAFARGQLVEEREALEILSLAATGQTTLARMRATSFRREYPNSMLLRSIEAALADAP